MRRWDLTAVGSKFSKTHYLMKKAEILSLEWSPANDLVAAACGPFLFLLPTGTASPSSSETLDSLLSSSTLEKIKGDDNNNDDDSEDEDEDENDDKKEDVTEWLRLGDGKGSKEYASLADGGDEYRQEEEEEEEEEEDQQQQEESKYSFLQKPLYGKELGIIIHHSNNQAVFAYVSWHRKGNYLASLHSLSGEGDRLRVMVHQISRRKSQPIKLGKKTGLVQKVAFHPNKPYFLVASQTGVRIYDLMNQELIKRFRSGAKWISSLTVHPSGDHFVVGSYDKRVCWFDFDLGENPFKTLRYHSKAVRQVAFHPRYPLLASASDDGTIHLFHAQVYSDFTRDPMIVPVKILRNGHEPNEDGLSILSLVFHPVQPWLFSCGADGTVILWINLH